MIEGLKIDVPSTELKEHLAARASHHGERVAFYLGQAKHLSQGLKDLDLEDESEAQAYSNSGQRDPRDSMRQSAKSHQDRQMFFQFMADHLVPGEVYRLTEADIIKLEFASRYL